MTLKKFKLNLFWEKRRNETSPQTCGNVGKRNKTLSWFGKLKQFIFWLANKFQKYARNTKYISKTSEFHTESHQSGLFCLTFNGEPGNNM